MRCAIASHLGGNSQWHARYDEIVLDLNSTLTRQDVALKMFRPAKTAATVRAKYRHLAINRGIIEATLADDMRMDSHCFSRS